MAEFCRKCFDKNFGDFLEQDEKIVISKEKDICEGCGNVDYVVERVEKKGVLNKIVEFIKEFGI